MAAAADVCRRVLANASRLIDRLIGGCCALLAQRVRAWLLVLSREPVWVDVFGDHSEVPTFGGDVVIRAVKLVSAR